MDSKTTLRSNLTSRLPGVQVLRGLAVIAVVLFHLFPDVFPNGYLGVDLFFVISGFVVTPLIMRIFSKKEKRLQNLMKFYRRRFFRLLPAAGVTVVVTLILISLFGSIYDHARTARQALAAILLVGNFGAYRFSAGDYFDPNPNPLVHMWSLSAEEQIYFLVPLLMGLVAFLTRKKVEILYLLIGLLISGFLTQIYIFPGIFEWLGFRNIEGIIFYSPFSYIWKFSLGGIAYILHKKIESNFRNQFHAPISILMPLFLSGIVLSKLSWSGTDEALVLTIAFMLAFQLIPNEINRLSLTFYRMGNASYSIYLVHMPTIYVGMRSPYFHEINHSLRIVVTVCLMGVLSYYLYTYIETRYRENAELIPHARPRSIPQSLIVFIIVPLITASSFLALVTKTPGTFKKEELPVYAGDLDVECNRLTSGNACWYPRESGQGMALLIGDSIAIAYAEEFIRQSHEQNMTAVTMGLAGCSFITEQTVSKLNFPKLFNVMNSRVANNEVTCFQHNENVMRFVNRHKPKVIFLSQHSVDEDNEKYLEVEKKTLRRLRLQNIVNLNSLGQNLVVVGASPLLPPSRLVAMPTIWSVVGSRKPIMIEDLNVDFLDEDRYLKRQKKSLSINYRSVLNIFCGPTSCEVFKDGKWIFRDSSHLSVYGSTFLKGIFQQEVGERLLSSAFRSNG